MIITYIYLFIYLSLFLSFLLFSISDTILSENKINKLKYLNILVFFYILWQSQHWEQKNNHFLLREGIKSE